MIVDSYPFLRETFLFSLSQKKGKERKERKKEKKKEYREEAEKNEGNKRNSETGKRLTEQALGVSLETCQYVARRIKHTEGTR